MRRTPFRALVVVLLFAAAVACDRRVEDYVPGEEPARPDLTKIFPPEMEPDVRDAAAAPPAPPGMRGRTGSPPSDSSAGAAAVRGTVLVAGEFADRIPAGAVLFIIVRGQGAGPPIAVKRVTSPRLPYEFEIGPGDRMIQSIPFAGPFSLSARLDADGNATTRSSGDVQGATTEPVNPGDSGVRVVLDQLL